MQTISMIILAGGRSSRMGTDKADLVYQGKTFLEIQLAKAAALQIQDVVISGYRGSQQLGFPVLTDAQPEQGPLGGLSTCLGAIRNEWALVLAVDAPLVPVAELEKLIDAAQKCTAPACILGSGSNQHPLIGLYHRSLIPAMQEELTLRKGSVFAMLRRAGCSVYESSADPALFANVNDPESYRALPT